MHLSGVKEVSLCFACAQLNLKIATKRKRKRERKRENSVLRFPVSTEVKTVVEHLLFVDSNSYIGH